MPIPELSEKGLLPEGIFECTLSEIQEKYVYNERREALWAKFRHFLKQIREIPEFNVIYVDGSFTTDRENPGDIDLIVEVDSVTTQVELRLKHGDLLKGTYVKRIFSTDLLFAYEPQPTGVENLRDHFQKIKLDDAIALKLEPSTRKGLLRTDLQSWQG